MKKTRKSLYILIFIVLIVLVYSNENTQAYFQKDSYIAADSFRAVSLDSVSNTALTDALQAKTEFIAELKGKRTVYVSKTLSLDYTLKGFNKVNTDLNGGIFAQEIDIAYEAGLIDFVDSEIMSKGTAPIVKDTVKKGEIRLILVNTGANKGINTDQTILRLYFKSKCFFKSSRIYMKTIILADGSGAEYIPQHSYFAVTSLLTPGDLNGDGKISIGDLMVISGNYLKTTRYKDWESIMNADSNEDSIINIKDLAYVAAKLNYLINTNP